MLKVYIYHDDRVDFTITMGSIVDPIYLLGDRYLTLSGPEFGVEVVNRDPDTRKPKRRKLTLRVLSYI